MQRNSNQAESKCPVRSSSVLGQLGGLSKRTMQAQDTIQGVSARSTPLDADQCCRWSHTSGLSITPHLAPETTLFATTDAQLRYRRRTGALDLQQRKRQYGRWRCGPFIEYQRHRQHRLLEWPPLKTTRMGMVNNALGDLCALQ